MFNSLHFRKIVQFFFLENGGNCFRSGHKTGENRAQARFTLGT